MNFTTQTQLRQAEGIAQAHRGRFQRPTLVLFALTLTLTFALIVMVAVHVALGQALQRADDDKAVKTEADLVYIVVTVTDTHGNIVPDTRAADFRV